MAARSPQRGSPKQPVVPLDLDLRRQLAETRKAEAEAAFAEDERRRRNEQGQLDARKTELEIAEIEGRIRQQPLEAREREARIESEEVSALKDLSFVMAPPLILALGYVLGVVSDDSSWLLPMKLIYGGG
jgi:hypothetical protein